MKKTIFAILILTLTFGPALALFGLITKDDLQLVKAQIKSMTTNVESLAKIVAEIKVDIQNSMQAQAEMTAKISGIDQSMNQKLQAGGDIKSIITDPNIIKYFLIVIGLAIIVIAAPCFLGYLILMAWIRNVNKTLKMVIEGIKNDPTLVVGKGKTL